MGDDVGSKDGFGVGLNVGSLERTAEGIDEGDNAGILIGPVVG